MQQNKHRGFTLIEVLLALMVVAIALTALVKSTSQSIMATIHIKNKTISHLVAMQGVTLIQLGLLNVPHNQEITEITNMLGQKWYWRAKLTQTSMKHVSQITITVSQHQTGPFSDQLIAFRYTP